VSRHQNSESLGYFTGGTLPVASSLRRAVRTAELAGLGGATVDADLHEWDYDGYEGIMTAEIHRTRTEQQRSGSVPGRDSAASTITMHRA